MDGQSQQSKDKWEVVPTLEAEVDQLYAHGCLHAECSLRSVPPKHRKYFFFEKKESLVRARRGWWYIWV